jgi:hypothetical protein
MRRPTGSSPSSICGLGRSLLHMDMGRARVRARIRQLSRQLKEGLVTPYDIPHARLSPGLLNDTAEIDVALAATGDMA